MPLYTNNSVVAVTVGGINYLALPVGVTGASFLSSIKYIDSLPVYSSPVVRTVAAGLKITMTSQNLNKSGTVKVYDGKVGIGLEALANLDALFNSRLGSLGFRKYYPAVSANKGGLLFLSTYRPISSEAVDDFGSIAGRTTIDDTQAIYSIAGIRMFVVSSGTYSFWDGLTTSNQVYY